MIEFEKVCIDIEPGLVVVVGDVNSTIACALVAAKLGIKSAHVEAGLRSFDRSMPEEINRVLTDSISDILLTPSMDANYNLRKEGRGDEDIYFVGNIMIDSLVKNLEHSANRDITGQIGIHDQKFCLLTLHRPSNVDTFEALEAIVLAIEHISNDMRLVFPYIQGQGRTYKSLV